jgi:hypothetical protein
MRHKLFGGSGDRFALATKYTVSRDRDDPNAGDLARTGGQ